MLKSKQPPPLVSRPSSPLSFHLCLAASRFPATDPPRYVRNRLVVHAPPFVPLGVTLSREDRQRPSQSKNSSPYIPMPATRIHPTRSRTPESALADVGARAAVTMMTELVRQSLTCFPLPLPSAVFPHCQFLISAPYSYWPR